MTPKRDPPRSMPNPDGTRRKPATARALGMLSAFPVQAVAVDRVHVGHRQPGGTLNVLDRPTGERLLIYTPRLSAQFMAGHRMSRWYVRPASDVSCHPRSPGFATTAEAIEAVRVGRWSLRAAAAAAPGPRPVRVIWTASLELATRASRVGSAQPISPPTRKAPEPATGAAVAFP
jgi:hypothetical protein